MWECACVWHTCLCGTAVWPASDSFSILSPSQGGVCVGVLTDYAVSFLPLAELHILWSQRASEIFTNCVPSRPFETGLKTSVPHHDKHVSVLCECTHRSHSRHFEFPGEWVCLNMGSRSDGIEEPFLVPQRAFP